MGVKSKKIVYTLNNREIVRREELIFKVISGNASKAETKKVELSLNESEENQQIFNEQKLVWDIIGTVKKDTPVDLDKAWAKFVVQKENSTQKTSKLIYKIAAILIVVLSIGSIGTYTFFGNKSSNFSQIAKVILPAKKTIKKPTIESSFLSSNNTDVNHKIVKRKINKETKQSPYVEYVLTDSSTVKLNDNGALKFLDYSQNNSRIASLVGAGIFDIKPSNQLFILETDEIIIHVEGTKFNINPDENNKSIEIFVEEGSMNVYDKQNLNNTVSLTSGQKYIFDVQTRKFNLLKTQNKKISKWKLFWQNIGKK